MQPLQNFKKNPNQLNVQNIIMNALEIRDKLKSNGFPTLPSGYLIEELKDSNQLFGFCSFHYQKTEKIIEKIAIII